MIVETIRTQLQYHIWANRRVWDCIEQVSDEQFHGDWEYSVGGLYEQAFHLAATDWWVFTLLDESQETTYLSPEDAPDRETLRTKWDEIEARIQEFADTLTEDKLARLVPQYAGEGQTFGLAMAEMLLMIVTHGMNHRAQILALLHQYGAPTVEMGQYFYFHEQFAAEAAA